MKASKTSNAVIFLLRVYTFTDSSHSKELLESHYWGLLHSHNILMKEWLNDIIRISLWAIMWISKEYKTIKCSPGTQLLFLNCKSFAQEILLNQIPWICSRTERLAEKKVIYLQNVIVWFLQIHFYNGKRIWYQSLISKAVVHQTNCINMFQVCHKYQQYKN